MDELSFSNALTWLLMAIFLVAGVLNLLGRQQLRATYASWGYPTRYRYVAGIIYIVAAALLTVPLYRFVGLALVAILLFLMIVTLLDRQEYAGALSRFGLLGALWVSVLAGAS